METIEKRKFADYMIIWNKLLIGKERWKLTVISN